MDSNQWACYRHALSGALNKPNSDNCQYFCLLFCALFKAILSPILLLKLSAKILCPLFVANYSGLSRCYVSLYHDSHPAFPAMRPHSLIVRLSCVKTFRLTVICPLVYPCPCYACIEFPRHNSYIFVGLCLP